MIWVRGALTVYHGNRYPNKLGTNELLNYEHKLDGQKKINIFSSFYGNIINLVNVKLQFEMAD